jgi:tetratricopeptide (TPR) repeat protein
MRRAPVLFLLLVAGVAFAQDETSLYNAGNAAYAAGDYAGAVAKYEQARGVGASHPDLCLNLGNAYYQAGKLGRAVLNYERGLRLAPGDDDLRFNLRLARSRTKDAVERPEEGFLGGLARQAADRVAVPLAVHLGVALYLLFCTAVLVAVLARRRPVARGWAIAAAGAVLAVALLLSPLFYVVAARASAAEGVIVDPVVEVTSGPGKDFPAVFTVHEGMDVAVREVRGDWAQVTIPSGLSGWVPRAAYDPI